VGLEAPHPQVQAVCVETTQLTDTYKGACARTKSVSSHRWSLLSFSTSALL
jgi:hypothetical protein